MTDRSPVGLMAALGADQPVDVSAQRTTLTKGNMYSFVAIAASGDSQCTTVGSR